MPTNEILSNLLAASPNKWELERTDTIDSTNSECARRFSNSDSAPHFIIWAEEQTEGRGRLERKWLSNPGKDITASVVFPSPAPQASIPKLVLPAGIALVAVLREEYGIRAAVRWPNDVLVNGHKLAGILCSYLARPNAVICGIGINVNSDPDLTDTEFNTPVTTMLRETGSDNSRDRLFALWLLEFEKLWFLSLNENFRILKDTFDRINFYREKPVRIIPGAAAARNSDMVDESHAYIGIVESLDPEGALTINLHDDWQYSAKIDDIIIPQ